MDLSVPLAGEPEKLLNSQIVIDIVGSHRRTSGTGEPGKLIN